MIKQDKMKKVAGIILFTVYLSAGRLHALPSLQLYIDPAANPGATYNLGSQTWVYSGNTLTLTAFAVDKNFGSHNGNAFAGTVTDAYLSIALEGGSIPSGSLGDTLPASAFGTLNINGGDSPLDHWVYGIPPEATVDSMDCAADLAPHGVFPTWFTQYQFNFGSYGASVFNTQPGKTGTDTGFRKDFTIDLGNIDASVVHFDLFTLNSDSNIRKFAPYSHDAEANTAPVPEPASAALLALGLGVASLVKRRNSLKGNQI